MDRDPGEKHTDEELVELALNQKEFFAYIVERYHERMRRYIHKITRASREDVEDLLQEIFIKVYINLNGFDRSLAFSSWVYRIAHNHVISWYRKNKVRPQGNSLDIEDDVLHTLMGEMNIESDYRKKEDATRLLKALDQLDQKYRQVLILRFFEEKDYREISDILERPMGTIATLLNRAKTKLAKQYNTIHHHE